MTTRYALIGAGGTGTFLLPGLYRYLSTHHADQDWELGIIDGDTVEPKNLGRQLFASNHINTNKALAAAETINDERVIGVPHYLDGENIERYLPDGTTVLIAADNYPVRARIERHIQSLPNGIVINGGNERDEGSCQIYVRRDGKDVTPRLSFLHPEILSDGPDRAAMSCVQVAALPGGEQLIIANMASATWMLSALHKVLSNDIRWTEMNFELMTGNSVGMDHRKRRGALA